MISTEVQRTLVKSPPELWAELSNPDALARHLGELGAIRITRTDPEKLVEWEAEGATGKVAIKPSGWGTRVTLSVERALPATDEASDSDAAEEHEDGAASPEAAHVEAVVAELEESTVVQSVDSETQSASAVPAEESPTETSHHEEPKPAPATEAARRAAGWPAAEGGGPAIESVLRAAETDAPEAPQVQGAWPTPSPQAQAQAAADVDPAPEAEASTPEQLAQTATATSDPSPEATQSIEPEPRRGFFARLFGGRRKRPVTASQPVSESTPLDARAPEETIEAEPAGEGPDAVEANAEPTIEPGQAIADEEAVDAEGTAQAVDTIAAEPTVEAVEPRPAYLPSPPAAALPVTVVEEAPVAAVQDEPVAEATEPQAASAPDIAAELRAAEESASEEVTAILTGVLDRLGAAHHRPFSRA